MKKFFRTPIWDTPIWSPSADELAQIDRQVRAERAKAAQDAIRFVTRKSAGPAKTERAATH
ncbi:MAG TPA: hypothetical protein VMX97_00465 [Hyphomicrobiaceae bacterium]|nr:hypothetical protein [Hyphomicrobiaceae bacterium]